MKYTKGLILFGGRRRRLGGLLLGLGRQFVAEFNREPVAGVVFTDCGTITDDRVIPSRRWQRLKWSLLYQRVSE